MSTSSFLGKFPDKQAPKTVINKRKFDRVFAGIIIAACVSLAPRAANEGLIEHFKLLQKLFLIGWFPDAQFRFGLFAGG